MGFDIFKKKKAENKLAAAKQRNIIEIPIANPPKKPVTLIDQKPSQTAVAANTPPIIIMPKPRRAITPTRAILNQFENDKTQVEDDNSVINISPVTLPLLIQEQDQVIRKPVPTKKVVLQHNNSQSTSSSKTSSKVYESAQEYNSDEDDTRFSNLPSSILLKKKSMDPNNTASDSSSCTVTPRLRPNPVRPSASCTTLDCTRDNVVPVLAAVPTTTASDVDIATAALAAEYESNRRNPIAINNNTNYREMDNNEMNNEAIAPSHNNSNFHNNGAINNDNNQRDNTNTDPETVRINYVDQAMNNAYCNDQDRTQRRVTPDHIKEGQDELLNQLKRKVEMMEKQRILDREEWCRKERELLNHRMAMAEHLDETKKQLVDVIKIKEETTKANEAYYQQQLKEHQLNQLQNTVVNNHAYSPEQELEDVNHDIDVDHHHHAAETNLAEEDTDYQRVVYTEEPEHYERRLPRMRSRGELRYHARSTSRGSHRYSQYYPEEEQERRPASHLSRRNSTASARLDPSPSATLVSNPMTPRTRVNRTRSKSIESGNWGNSIPKVYEPVDHVQSNRYRVRRSRSVGRRPPSRGPPVVFYADLDDDVDDVVDVGDYPYYDNYRFAHQPQAYYHDEYYMPQQPQQPGPPIQSSYYHYAHQYRQQNYERYGRGRYNY